MCKYPWSASLCHWREGILENMLAKHHLSTTILTTISVRIQNNQNQCQTITICLWHALHLSWGLQYSVKTLTVPTRSNSFGLPCMMNQDLLWCSWEFMMQTDSDLLWCSWEFMMQTDWSMIWIMFWSMLWSIRWSISGYLWEFKVKKERDWQDDWQDAYQTSLNLFVDHVLSYQCPWMKWAATNSFWVCLTVVLVGTAQFRWVCLCSVCCPCLGYQISLSLFVCCPCLGYQLPLSCIDCCPCLGYQISVHNSVQVSQKNMDWQEDWQDAWQLQRLLDQQPFAAFKHGVLRDDSNHPPWTSHGIRSWRRWRRFHEIRWRSKSIRQVWSYLIGGAQRHCARNESPEEWHSWHQDHVQEHHPWPQEPQTT